MTSAWPFIARLALSIEPGCLHVVCMAVQRTALALSMSMCRKHPRLRFAVSPRTAARGLVWLAICSRPGGRPTGLGFTQTSDLMSELRATLIPRAAGGPEEGGVLHPAGGRVRGPDLPEARPPAAPPEGASRARQAERRPRGPRRRTRQVQPSNNSSPAKAGRVASVSGIC